MKVDAKLAELVALTPKFAIEVTSKNCATNATGPLHSVGQKVIFWAVSERLVTARKSMQNWPNWRY
jgi:hypothetical protein